MEKEKSAGRLLAKRLHSLQMKGPIRLMEVCGTHTVAIRRSGIPHTLPEGVRLVSGPGCPVCVTPASVIDEAVYLARQGYHLATFGDMMRVPGSHSSLQKERAAGAKITVIYSPLEALALAQKRSAPVVLLAVGFETTVPAIAVTVRTAKEKKIADFSILSSLRLIPPALRALVSGPTPIDGLLLPGHVSAIIGALAYRFLERQGLSAVISGFESEEILSSLLRLLEMIALGKPAVQNNYPTVVRQRGNPRSRRIVRQLFSPCDTSWRGLGIIPRSGLQLAGEWERYDIRKHVSLPVGAERLDPSCRCGDVLTGAIDPPGCPLFRLACTPESPRGACMVSSEGACQAWFRYG